MIFLVWWTAFALVWPAHGLGAVIPEALDIEQKLADYKLDSVTLALPSELLTIRFGSQEVMLGTEICPFDTIYYPFLGYDGNSRSMYTLICINPDISYYLNMTYDLSYLIFLSVNIPGDNVDEGDLLSGFKPAVPIPGTGQTRNACFVYRQPRKITVNTELLTKIVTNIYQFDLNEFLKDNRLGTPIAGNFYLTETSLCQDDSGGSCGNNSVCNFNCCNC